MMTVLMIWLGLSSVATLFIVAAAFLASRSSVPTVDQTAVLDETVTAPEPKEKQPSFKPAYSH